MAKGDGMSFRISDDDRKKLDWLCKMDDRTQSNMIIHLIRMEYRRRNGDSNEDGKEE